jgi:hypothetical protein
MKASSWTRIAGVAALLAQSAVPATAQGRADSAAFTVRLGVDTTSLERYVRTADRIDIEAVQRSPATSLHRLTLRLGPEGGVSGGEYTIWQIGAAAAVTRRTFEFDGDSATLTTQDSNNRRVQRVAARDAIPLAGPLYTPYELAIMRIAGSTAARGEVPLLAGSGVVRIPIERIARDSVRLDNQFGEPMRAHIDAQGRLLHLHTPAFTTVERSGWIDLDRLAADFADRDRSGRGMGPLSPRSTQRMRVGNANLWLDYSRPAMRGRPVWGQLVPWNAVWRLGANDATHFATDRAVDLGNLTLQPGTYTLFLLPAPDRWTLVVNRATGMSGLDHDPAQDVGRIEMTREQIDRPVEQFTIQVEPAENGLRLSIAWDRTRAFVPLRVR